MAVNDELGKRMREFYEIIPKHRLMRRTPVIIRIDGKAFHTFLRNFKKPFDQVLRTSMQKTMKYLCENIQGCVLGYTQSDEISLLLVDYKKLNSSAWFDNEIQKICSISASMATLAFNKTLAEEFDLWFNRLHNLDSSTDKLYNAYQLAIDKGAMFDARCFNIPKEEVTNYFYWRQLDATRNSIEMVGYANFSHKELHNKSCNMIQDMLHEQKGINWNDFLIPEKRGTCCIKQNYLLDSEGCRYQYPTDIDDQLKLSEFLSDKSLRSEWILDKEIPIWKSEDRNYIDRLVFVEEE